MERRKRHAGSSDGRWKRISWTSSSNRFGKSVAIADLEAEEGLLWGEAENCTFLDIGTGPSIDGKKVTWPNSDLHPTTLTKKAVTVFLVGSIVPEER
jgi:hypothetical protein